LTSGVLLLGRTKEEACAVSALLRGAPGSGVIRKRYFALVEGSFPRFSGDSVASHAPGGFCNEENSLCFDSSFPGFPFYDFEVHGSPLRVRVQELGSIDVDPVSPTQPPCPWISSFRPQPGFASLSENGNTVGGTARENDQGRKGRKRVRNEEGYTEGTFTPNDPTASKEDNVKLSPKSNLPVPNPPLAWTSHGYLRVDVPLRTLDEKNALQGVAAAGEGGGESCTLFKFVGEVTRRPPSGSQYPPLTLVQCLPLSGRSHQIRVHLAYLGFPIWDDPLYSPSAAKELERRVEAEGKRERGGGSTGVDSILIQGAPGPTGKDLQAALSSVCSYCTRGGDWAEFSPSQRLVQSISLHSAEYTAWAKPKDGKGATQEGPLWDVKCPLPPWVNGKNN